MNYQAKIFYRIGLTHLYSNTSEKSVLLKTYGLV